MGSDLHTNKQTYGYYNVKLNKSGPNVCVSVKITAFLDVVHSLKLSERQRFGSSEGDQLFLMGQIDEELLHPYT
jgi:hypothetical protein